ncbi:MAG: RNHCP domain-containing protein [Minisyncoccia bacterium]
MTEANNQDFICSHCGKKVTYERNIGTEHRNHCPYCLWSQHEDLNIPGDRKSNCHGQMEPIGLTFKKEGQDKYGLEKQGELMLIHCCTKCGKISINRLAADDDNQVILAVFEKSKKMNSKQKTQLQNQGIQVLGEEDKKEILNQLFGRGVDIL